MIDSGIKDRKIDLDKKHRILIFCGSGYGFNEFFAPVIEEISQDCAIDLLLGDYYLTDYTLNLVKRLHSESKLSSYRVINPSGRFRSAFERYRTMHSITQSLKAERFDILLLGTDFVLFERYLIDLARSKGALVAILQIGQLIYVLEEYRKLTGLPIQKKDNSSRNIIRSLRKRAGIIKRKVEKCWRVVKDQYLLPLIFMGRYFSYSPYDRFTFTSGRADLVLCYDPLEIEALKKVIPPVKNVYCVKHPVTGYCKCKTKINQGNRKKLLVTFSGCIDNELAKDKFFRWEEAIKHIVNLTAIDEVHLRFHPRTSPNLNWPRAMLEAVKRLKCEVKVIDALKVSLIDTVCDYVGMLGAPSGALRAARAVCPGIFVTALADCGDPSPWEQEWSLGSAEGINWIRNEEQIQLKHLKVPEIDINNKPSASDILRELLKNK